MLKFLIGFYVITSIGAIGALLDSEETNQNKKEALFCIVAGILWPLATLIVSYASLYDSLSKKHRQRQRRQRERQEDKYYQMKAFIRQLAKLELVSKPTAKEVIFIINSRLK